MKKKKNHVVNDNFFFFVECISTFNTHIFLYFLKNWILPIVVGDVKTRPADKESLTKDQSSLDLLVQKLGAHRALAKPHFSVPSLLLSQHFHLVVVPVPVPAVVGTDEILLLGLPTASTDDILR